MKAKTERDVLLQLALPEVEQDIYALLGERMRIADIGRVLKISTTTASLYVSRLYSKGLIKRVSRGVYERKFRTN